MASEKKISLVLDEKEAIMLHICYNIGASAVKGESLETFALLVNNARDLLPHLMHPIEMKIMKKKMTVLGAAIDPATLARHHIRLEDQ